MSLGEKHVNRHPSKWLYPHSSCTSNGSQFIDPDEYWSGGVCPVFGFSNSILLCFNVRGPNPRHKKVLSPASVSNILTIFILAIFCATPKVSWVTDAAAAAGCVGHCDDNLSVRGARSYHAPSVIRKYGEWQQKQTVNNSAVKLSIGSTTGCTITEKAPTRAFSWLKAPTSTFTFKTLLRHYSKWALTPQ